jgi:putative tricarboxylic transport membrane protein
MKLSDRMTGLALILLGAAACWGGARLPPVPGQQIGPSVFPMVVGAGLMLVGALIALHIGRRFEEEAEAELAEHGGAEAGDGAPVLRPWLAALPPSLMIFYYFAVERLGFVPVAAIMIAVLAYAARADRRLIAPVALGAAVAIQIVFVKLLRVPLPPGLLPLPW